MEVNYLSWRTYAPWVNVACVLLLCGLALNEMLHPNPRIVIIVFDIICAGFNIFAAWNWWRGEGLVW